MYSNHEDSEISKKSNSFELWDFSIAAYGKRGIESLCLKLQQEINADINVLLYLLWLSTFKRQLKSDQILSVINVTKFWQSQVVQPIRKTRKILKKSSALSDNAFKEETYSDLLELELIAEKFAQKQLFGDGVTRHIGDLASTKEAAARANLKNYIEILDGTINTADIDELSSILKQDYKM
ncbi:MAG: TIGR02444 family protein [Porticoccaceae bacterium]|nr:TIGR02444 family protein [Porticoccaceae bacterium]|tara:strand:- start:3481 stop:4023 length:543 start_codon:yes stop_codon:yes gene_type:complete